MNKGRPMTEFAQDVIRQSAQKKDYIASTSMLDMVLASDSLGASKVSLDAALQATDFTRTSPPVTERRTGPANFALRLGELGSFLMQKLSHDQLQEYCQIPRIYYDRCRNEAPQLLVENVRHWLHAKTEERMIRTLDGKARAFLSDRYRPLDNYDLIQAVLPPLLKAQADIVSCELTETRMYIKATSHRITVEPKVGDIIEAGVSVTNSEVGMGRLSVAPFLNRLSCMNGAQFNEFGTRRTHIGKRTGRRGSDELTAGGGNSGGGIPEEWLRDETRVADDKAFFMTVQDVVSASFDQTKFEAIAKMLTDSTKRTIDADVPKVVEVVKDRFGYSDDEGKAILQNLIKGADLSQYGLWNSVTATAGTISDYDRSSDLERSSAGIVEMSDHEWNALLKEAA